MSDLHRFPYCQYARLGLIVALAASTVACGSFDKSSNSIVGMVTPYKMEVVQGNFVSREQAATLAPGMSRIEVRNVLGSALLADVFHGDRWDYVFTFRRQGQEPQARRLTVFFKGDVLERVESDPLPTEAEFVASLDSGRRSGSVPVLEASEDDLKNFPAVAIPAAARPLPPMPASYPPLEPTNR